MEWVVAGERELESKDFRKLWFRRQVAYPFFIPFCGAIILILRYVRGYQIEDLKALRAYYRELTDAGQPPLMICSNHLSYIDSILLIYAFGNHFWYFFHFRRLSWNLPAANYAGNLFFRVVGFFSKCIFIDREGAREHKHRILDLGRTLIKKGEPLTVFPEGRRSRTGRFDDSKLAYGIGKILAPLPEARVLCVYLRANNQKEASKFPRVGSRFRILHELKNYRPRELGTAAVETLTKDVAATIQALEQKYFDEAPSFHC